MSDIERELLGVAADGEEQCNATIHRVMGLNGSYSARCIAPAGHPDLGPLRHVWGDRVPSPESKSPLQRILGRWFS